MIIGYNSAFMLIRNLNYKVNIFNKSNSRLEDSQKIIVLSFTKKSFVLMKKISLIRCYTLAVL